MVGAAKCATSIIVTSAAHGLTHESRRQHTRLLFMNLTLCEYRTTISGDDDDSYPNNNETQY